MRALVTYILVTREGRNARNVKFPSLSLPEARYKPRFFFICGGTRTRIWAPHIDLSFFISCRGLREIKVTLKYRLSSKKRRREVGKGAGDRNELSYSLLQDTRVSPRIKNPRKNFVSILLRAKGRGRGAARASRISRHARIVPTLGHIGQSFIKSCPFRRVGLGLPPPPPSLSLSSLTLPCACAALSHFILSSLYFICFALLLHLAFCPFFGLTS